MLRPRRPKTVIARPPTHVEDTSSNSKREQRVRAGRGGTAQVAVRKTTAADSDERHQHETQTRGCEQMFGDAAKGAVLQTCVANQRDEEKANPR